MGYSEDDDDAGIVEEVVWLRDFEFNNDKVPAPTILLVGKRFSGKSYTSVSIAHKFKTPRWAAFCGTKDTEDFWTEKFESSASVRGPDERGKHYLIKLIKYQQRKSRLYSKVLKEPFPLQYQIGLIFDDVTAKREFRKGEMLEDLFSNGRHYHAVIIISCQYLKQLPPAVRLNTDYMFLMHNTKRTCKVLYEDYVENPETFAGFLDLLRTVTGQTDAAGKDLFNSLVYDNVVKSAKLNEMFKIYRNEGLKAINEMKIGSEEWREYNKTHYKDKDQEMQMREYRKRKRLLRIQEYRKQQMLKRMDPSAFVSNDLDYFSDSDSDEECHDSVYLGRKNGPKTTVNFSKQSVSQKSQSERSEVLARSLDREVSHAPKYCQETDADRELRERYEMYNQPPPTQRYNQNPYYPRDYFPPTQPKEYYPPPPQRDNASFDPRGKPNQDYQPPPRRLFEHLETQPPDTNSDSLSWSERQKFLLQNSVYRPTPMSRYF